MRNPLDPYKTTNIFSNPNNWAVDMNFHHPAWVCSFYAESRERADLKGSDASVHLNIQYSIRPLRCLSYDLNENENENRLENRIENRIKNGSSVDDYDEPNFDNDSSLSPTFSFRNKEIFPPRKLLYEPDVEISWNNEIRKRNESYAYNEDNEYNRKNKSKIKNGSRSKSLGSAMSGVTDGSNSTTLIISSNRTTCESTLSTKNNFPPGTFFSPMSKNILDRRRSNMSSTTYKGCDYDSEDEEMNSLYRVDHRRLVYTMPVTRPPFYPPDSKGIPKLYGVNALLKNSTPRSPMPPIRAFSTDSPIPRGRRIFQDDIPEKSLQRNGTTVFQIYFLNQFCQLFLIFESSFLFILFLLTLFYRVGHVHYEKLYDADVVAAYFSTLIQM